MSGPPHVGHALIAPQVLPPPKMDPQVHACDVHLILGFFGVSVMVAAMRGKEGGIC